jgi:hypothetical protein
VLCLARSNKLSLFPLHCLLAPLAILVSLPPLLPPLLPRVLFLFPPHLLLLLLLLLLLSSSSSSSSFSNICLEPASV